MVSVDKLELLQWREMESIHVLRVLADHIKEDPSFHPRSSHQTTRWHVHVAGRDWEFLCTGPKFWDVRMGRGGGGAIDLVMHLHALNFKAAITLLKEIGV